MRPDARISRLVREVVLVVPTLACVAAGELLIALALFPVGAEGSLEAGLTGRVHVFQYLERYVGLTARWARFSIAWPSRSWRWGRALLLSSLCRAQPCGGFFCRTADRALHAGDSGFLFLRGLLPSCHSESFPIEVIARSARTAVSHPPDLSRSIIGYEKGSVAENEHVDRPAPDRPTVLIGHPAGDEVVVAAGGLAVAERDADDLVSGAAHAIPRTMKRDERAAAVLFGKHLALIENDAQRCGMRLDEKGGNDCAGDEIASLTAAARIFMLADVAVRPAVEGTVAHVRHVIRNEIVAKAVALIDRSP